MDADTLADIPSETLRERRIRLHKQLWVALGDHRSYYEHPETKDRDDKIADETDPEKDNDEEYALDSEYDSDTDEFKGPRAMVRDVACDPQIWGMSQLRFTVIPCLPYTKMQALWVETPGESEAEAGAHGARRDSREVLVRQLNGQEWNFHIFVRRK